MLASPFRLPLPHILGADPAGDVVEVGSMVEGLSPGDRVVSIQFLWCGRCPPCSKEFNNACVRLRIQGVHTDGGDAEYAVVPAQNLVPIDASLSYEEASAMIVMHPTAWHLLIDRGALQPGETVLILAAGGALGTAGIQVAKLAGARVIAAAGADWKLEKARELGADEVVNYTTQSLSDADEHIDLLSKKYLGQDRYPFRREGQQRIILRGLPVIPANCVASRSRRPRLPGGLVSNS